jgi:hypothetical protein
MFIKLIIHKFTINAYTPSECGSRHRLIKGIQDPKSSPFSTGSLNLEVVTITAKS